MKKICLLIFCLLFIQNVFGQRTRETLSEDEQKLSDELKNDKEYIQISCERRSAVSNPDRDISYRLKVIQVFSEGGEKLKLKKTCGTIEGDPIFAYLTVEKGKAKFFIDTSQDDFGKKQVYIYECSALNIGIYFNDLKEGKMVFQKIESSEGKGHQIVLQCLEGSKDLIF